MKKRSMAIIAFALLFCILGVLWLSVIYQRSLLFSGEKFSPYNQLYKQSVSTYQTIRKNVAYVSAFMAKACLILFWIIGALELVCALLYFLSGWALFRMYSFARELTIFSVSLDVLLKLLLSVYNSYIALPLQYALKNQNILTSFYVPDKSVISKLSCYLTGIKLVQPQAIFYVLGYSTFVCLVFYVFTRKTIVEQFNK
jgi:hypothetical protein